MMLALCSFYLHSLTHSISSLLCRSQKWCSYQKFPSQSLWWMFFVMTLQLTLFCPWTSAIVCPSSTAWSSNVTCLLFLRCCVNLLIVLFLDQHYAIEYSRSTSTREKQHTKWTPCLVMSDKTTSMTFSTIFFIAFHCLLVCLSSLSFVCNDKLGWWQ